MFWVNIWKLIVSYAENAPYIWTFAGCFGTPLHGTLVPTLWKAFIVFRNIWNVVSSENTTFFQFCLRWAVAHSTRRSHCFAVSKGTVFGWLEQYPILLSSRFTVLADISTLELSFVAISSQVRYLSFCMILPNTVQSFEVKIVGLSGRKIGLSLWSFFS